MDALATACSSARDTRASRLCSILVMDSRLWVSCSTTGVAISVGSGALGNEGLRLTGEPRGGVRYPSLAVEKEAAPFRLGAEGGWRGG